MTISPAVAADIRRLYFAEHWKRGTIAAQLGVHFDVVVRVLGSLGAKAGAPRPAARVLEPYMSFIDETLARYPKLVATRIQDMLVERGYQGSIRTLRRYAASHRPAPRHEVFLRMETLPGEQAQVDWAHVGSLAVPFSLRALHRADPRESPVVCGNLALTFFNWPVLEDSGWKRSVVAVAEVLGARPCFAWTKL